MNQPITAFSEVSTLSHITWKIIYIHIYKVIQCIDKHAYKKLYIKDIVLVLY